MKRFFSAIFLSLVLSFGSFAAPVERDVKLAYQNITNLQKLVKEFEDMTPVFEKLERDSRLPHEEAFKIKKLWGRIFDMRVALNALLQTYVDYELKSATDNAKAVLVKYTSTLALVNTGARISKLIWEMPETHKLLNELHRNYPLGTLVSLENQIFKMYKDVPFEGELPSFFPEVDMDKLALEYALSSLIPLSADIERELQRIQTQESQTFEKTSKPFLKTFAHKLTVYGRYAKFQFKNLFSDIVTKVSTWLGDTKVKRRSDAYYNGKTYINLEQAREFEQGLRPGDIMISRTNWFLSNAFLPGFWPHSFIYVGNLKKLKTLDANQEINNHYQEKCSSLGLACESFTGYLKASSTTAKAFAAYLKKAKDGHEKVLIEATSDGVHFSSIRHTFLNDFLAAMRPQISELAKAQAIEESMKFHGMPYDFDFDYDTHSSLVCSELVAKSFSSKVTFDYDRENGVYVEEYLNRYSLPVIGIVNKMVDENVDYLRSSELEFVGFLKGVPERKEAVLASEKEFYESAQWPKWSFMQ